MQHEITTEHLIDPLSEQPATEHARNHLSLSRLDSLASGLEVVRSFGTTATEHGCRLINAVSSHCNLSLVLRLCCQLRHKQTHPSYKASIQARTLQHTIGFANVMLMQSF